MSVRGGLPDAPYAWDVAIRNLWAWGSVPSQNQLERIPRALRALVGLAFAAWLMFENVNRFSQRSPGLVTLSIATAAAVIATIVYLFVFPRHSSPGRRLAIVGLLGAIAIASMILLGNANPGQVAAFVTVITATELFTVDAVPGVRAALTELRDRSLAGIGRRLTLTGLPCGRRPVPDHPRPFRATALPPALRVLAAGRAGTGSRRRGRPGSGARSAGRRQARTVCLGRTDPASPARRPLRPGDHYCRAGQPSGVPRASGTASASPLPADGAAPAARVAPLPRLRRNGRSRNRPGRSLTAVGAE
jgi:hypothetical protein